MNWKRKLHEVIFEADTPAGKTFDLILLLMIVLSVLVVILESVDFINERFSSAFFGLEWVFTILFSIEYILRIISVGKPWKYITSFYGIVDLFSILPTYLSLFFVGTHYLITIRALRLLRIFRILKLGNYLTESRVLLSALKASQQKITVFLVAVMTIVLIVGAGMYLIEGGEDSGFDSIPRSMYWAIVTVTTVGYGDITPSTTLGQFLSAILMVMGYGILAVPTGIISSELTHIQAKGEQGYNTQSCPNCSREGHDNDATHCKYCGSEL